MWVRANKICFTNAKKKVQCYPAAGGGGGGGGGRARKSRKKFVPMKLNRTAGNYSRVPKHKGSSKRKSYTAPKPRIQTNFDTSSRWGVRGDTPASKVDTMLNSLGLSAIGTPKRKKRNT